MLDVQYMRADGGLQLCRFGAKEGWPLVRIRLEGDSTTGKTKHGCSPYTAFSIMKITSYARRSAFNFACSCLSRTVVAT